MDNKQRGQIGEDLAVRHLQNQGYHILERNWRYSHAEVDIIAMDGEILVFIEVKTRSNTHFGQPEDFVSTKQADRLAKVANVYMEHIQHDWEIRFDIIAILHTDHTTAQINHIKGAFFPGISD